MDSWLRCCKFESEWPDFVKSCPQQHLLWDRKLAKYCLNEPFMSGQRHFNFYQSDEISPNPVTLWSDGFLSTPSFVISFVHASSIIEVTFSERHSPLLSLMKCIEEDYLRQWWCLCVWWHSHRQRVYTSAFAYCSLLHGEEQLDRPNSQTCIESYHVQVRLILLGFVIQELHCVRVLPHDDKGWLCVLYSFKNGVHSEVELGRVLR